MRVPAENKLFSTDEEKLSDSIFSSDKDEAKTPLETGQIPESFYEQQIRGEKNIFDYLPEKISQWIADREKRAEEVRQLIQEMQRSIAEKIESRIHQIKDWPEQSELEKEIGELSSQIEQVEAHRQNNGKFGLSVTKTLALKDIGLRGSVPLIERFTRKKYWEDKINERTRLYLDLKKNNLDRLQTNYNDLLQAKESLMKYEELHTIPGRKSFSFNNLVLEPNTQYAMRITTRGFYRCLLVC